ncbi:MAG: methyltransferase domain-containing protein [Paracoccaceae bacterium]
MSRPPQLTDRAALRRNQARAAAAGPALFLHGIAADEMKERLAEVNRTFTKPAIVTGWPDFWADRFPDATICPDEDVLALDRGAHDLVIHAMALHWADDPVGQLVQCLRALRPDGLFLGVMPGGTTLHELRAALAGAEAHLSGGLSPRILPMAEIRDMGGLLQRAGFALPVADSLRQQVSYADMIALMRDLRAMGETNALAARRRIPAPRALFELASAIYRQNFPLGTDRVAATFELVFLTGWAPAAGQPQPLRPGSATHRLADALRLVPGRDSDND